MPPQPDGNKLQALQQIDAIADEFEFAFHGGDRPRIEDFAGRVPPDLRSRLLGELLRIELEWVQRRGETITPQEYLTRFPQYAADIRRVLASVGDVPASAIESTRSGEETLPSVGATSVPTCPGRFGRFDLRQRLGAGGFGTVFLADDTQLGRQVALKIPKSSDGNRRFLAEARAAAKLQHPNIVTVHDSGIMDGNLYIVCAFVEGADLAATIRLRSWPLARLVTWIRDAARALAYSHSQGVVHRDVKPGNLLVGRNGQVYVADFGLARQVDESSSLTADGSILGTPAYMAPEQAAGRTAEIGPHSDQYSLGVVLYEVLTGRRPFLGNVHEVLQKVIHAPPPAPRSLHPKVPPELEAICLKTLAKDPQARYPSMSALADDLDRWLQLRAQRPARASWADLDWKQLVRSPEFKIVRAVGVFGGVLLGLWLLAIAFLAPRQMPGDRVFVPPQRVAPQPSEIQIRSAQQLAWLTAALQPGRAWELPAMGGSAQRSIFTCLTPLTGPEQFSIIVADAADPSRRDAWVGSLAELRPGADSSGALRSVTFHPVAANHQLPAPDVHGLVLAALADRELTWIGGPKPIPLREAAQALVVLPAEEVSRRMIAAVAPGKVWVGTLQQPGEASRQVTLSFTEFRDEGRHVRATLEAADNPFIMAPFVGVFDTAPLTLLAGRPIRLTRQSAAMGSADDWPVFTSPWVDYTLGLQLTDDGTLIGEVGHAALRLRPGVGIAGPLPRVEQWRNAIVPGTVWQGVVKFRDEPPSRISLTVAEVRDDAGYIRWLAADAEDPQRYCVYEGALNFQDDVIDGFALVMTMKHYAARSQDRRYGLFGNWGSLSEIKQHLRLSADGSTLLCRTREGEQITLTRDAVAAPLPLDRASFAATWRAAIAPGRVWEGAVHNTEFDQRSMVRLEVTTAPDDLGNLSVVFSVPDRPQARMQFQGSLQPDSDTAVNAFALKLKKRGPGEGPSVLFGGRPDAELYLRLAPDGEHLVGMCGFDGRWTEFLELQTAPAGARDAQ